MAVYTEVSEAQAAAFVQRLGHGTLRSLQPIHAGIENTNYFVGTDQGEWVLTLFERLQPGQLPFYLHYMQHLARHGLPVPEPQADADGQLLHWLNGKPASLEQAEDTARACLAAGGEAVIVLRDISTRASEASIREASCSRGISKEQNKTP